MSDTPMTPESDDEALRRVRSVDPSLDFTPDAEAVRRGVDEHLAAGDELAARRQGRSRRAVLVGAAAGVCALALAAGAGFAIGRTGESPTVARAAFNLGNAQGGSGVAPNGAANGAANGGPNTVGAPEAAGGGAQRDTKMSANAMSVAYWGGRTVFLPGDGLSTSGGSYPAFAYDPRAVDGEEAARRLAKALGLKGAPQQNEGGTTVGPTDGSGPTLTVGVDGLRSFWYYNPTADPYTCVQPEPAPAETKGSEDGSGDGSAGSTGRDAAKPCEQPTKPGPSADKAIAAAKDFMSAAGVDPAGFEWTADASMPGMTWVSAVQVVEGQQTGAMWGFQAVKGGEFSSVSGFLAPEVPLGDYEVVSPRVAVDRLNDARFGGFWGGPMPMAAEARGGVAADGAVSSDATAVAPGGAAPTPPAAPKPGSPIAWPVTQVTITGCELGLAQNYQPSGAVVLVPTYQCTAGDKGTYTVIAVADAQLDTSAG